MLEKQFENLCLSRRQLDWVETREFKATGDGVVIDARGQVASANRPVSRYSHSVDQVVRELRSGKGQGR
jgi:hypothetical protein